MRTLKALLCLSALAGGLAVSQAQNVYSLNVVGYVNVPVVGASGFTMIANPLNAANNTIGALIPTPPDFTTIYKFAGAGFVTCNFVFGAWDDGTFTLNPGEGCIVQSPSPFTTTFVGEVMQGTLNNAFPAGYSIRASMVPQAGTLTALGLTPASLTDFDTVYQYDSVAQGYVANSLVFGSWSPAEPTLKVGESIWLQTAAAGTWTRTFTVQ